jgi:hypothetical protein
VFQIGPIGSRNDVLMAFLTDGGVYVRAGCFFNTLTKFAAAVKAEHGANVHAKGYAGAIAMVKLHKKLWTPKDDWIASDALKAAGYDSMGRPSQSDGEVK